LGATIFCAISAACNIDKHRTVVPAFNVFVRERVSVGGTGFFEMPLEHKWDAAKDEMVLITFGPGSPDDFKYDFQFTVFIAINEVPTVQGQPILAVAHAMGCKVESILMAIEAESRRLGILT
jgi:hypothetical protein